MKSKKPKQVNYEELELFKNTNFIEEKKDKLIQVKVTASQKHVIETMAQARNMKISELILNLLQYEKDHNVIHNLVMENKFKEDK